MVWHCKVKTDLGCFVGEFGFHWVAWHDVLRPLGHSACWWWGFGIFVRITMQPNLRIEWYMDDLVKSSQGMRTGWQTTGCPLVETSTLYWQHSHFIIQHSIFVWLPTTADSRSSASSETTRVVTEALINSQRFCSVFLVSCCRHLQRAFLSPHCVSNRISPSHSCVPLSERILAHFVSGGAGSPASGHGGCNRAAVKLHCTAHWASYLTFVFWSIELKWCKQTLGSRQGFLWNKGQIFNEANNESF